MYEVTSQSNSRFKEFIKLCRDRNERDRQELCILDGTKLCSDVIKSGQKLQQLWVSNSFIEKNSALVEQLITGSEEVYLVNDSAAKRLSETVSPQGVVASVNRPRDIAVKDLSAYTRVLGLCNVQNPENVGGTIRTASALGFKAVVLSRDCADPWSPRSVRAGAGCQLKIRIHVTDDFRNTVEEINNLDFKTYASALHRDSVSLEKADKSGKIFLAIGNEGNGLPDDVISSCTGIISVPMSEEVESLNAAAAAAVMMWELRDRLI